MNIQFDIARAIVRDDPVGVPAPAPVLVPAPAQRIVPQVNLPYISPLNQQRQQQQLQRQRQRYVMTNQSPAIGLQSTSITQRSNISVVTSPTIAHDQQPQVATFIPDPILYDQPPPPSPSQSSTMTQAQRDYLDKLITDFVIFGM